MFFVDIPKETYGFSSGSRFVMFEAPLRHKGLVNFISEATSKTATLLTLEMHLEIILDISQELHLEFHFEIYRM